jgi:hypothetical protein
MPPTIAASAKAFTNDQKPVGVVVKIGGSDEDHCHSGEHRGRQHAHAAAGVGQGPVAKERGHAHS